MDYHMNVQGHIERDPEITACLLIHIMESIIIWHQIVFLFFLCYSSIDRVKTNSVYLSVKSDVALELPVNFEIGGHIDGISTH